MAVYGATKAFVLSFSEALHREYARDGIEVLGLCPGGTNTDFHAVAGNAAIFARLSQEPELVVQAGLRALERDRASVVSGWLNVAAALATRLVPRQAAAALAGKLMEPR
jgi:short-subunit dehydrogenase